MNKRNMRGWWKSDAEQGMSEEVSAHAVRMSGPGEGSASYPNSHAGSKLLPSLAPITMSDPGSLDNPDSVSM